MELPPLFQGTQDSLETPEGGRTTEGKRLPRGDFEARTSPYLQGSVHLDRDALLPCAVSECDKIEVPSCIMGTQFLIE
jgi:hypothetical protein